MNDGTACVRVDLVALGLDRGGHLLVERALARVPVGGRVDVHGSHPELAIHLRAWARARGHEFQAAAPGEAAHCAGRLQRGSADLDRWQDAERSGEARVDETHPPSAHPARRWGLAARGALVESSAPEFRFRLDDRDEVWAGEAAALYRQALASQWDPETAIPWKDSATASDELEDALVQVLTYLIENETAALVIPARFASEVHPHFREVQQLLAIQAADEARHIEVFTRRALVRRTQLGTSSAGGQASLKTLVDEPDFATASLLLSVLGEGSFVNLLWFLHEHAPDACTATLMRLVAQDEARHVAFGVAHLARHARLDPTLAGRMAAAIERRHDALRDTAGLNEQVFDALIVLAAGALDPARVEAGFELVQALGLQMRAGRRNRLKLLGFDAERADVLSALHTRNFM
ncbi:MAG: ferritin-like domain-containing protein [Planctomycetota bacterium]|nr:ferritin-like domain-containing protein [Planctomycetota bacterium]